MKDANGAFVVCNQGVTRLFNKKEEEIIGKTDYDFFDAEMAEFYQNKDRTALEAGHVCINEEWWTFGDNGEQALMETRKVPVRGADGKLLGVLGVARDITERKQAVSHLEEARARLQTVMSTIPDLVWLKDADGVYLSCNPAFERLYGASEAEIVGKTDYDFVDAELADFFRQKDREAMGAGRICINEESIIYADDGRPGMLETRKVPVLGADGKVVGVLGVARDISERKSIEKAFRDSEHMLQEAQRIAHVGSWDVDMVNDKLVWSDEIFRIWEIDKTKFKADFAAFVDTVHPEDRERVVQAYNDAVVNHSLYEVEHRLLFPDGRVKHILERGEPQYDAEGKPVRFIGTSLDITERKQAQQRMELLERAIDFSADTVFLIDAQLRFRYVNATACRSLGYSREELLAMGPCDIDPDMPRELALKMMKSSPVGETVNFETHHRAKDGHRYPVELSGVHFEDGGEKFSLSVVRDITERKRMQDELAEREREFRSLAENLPDNIARWDVEGRYLYVNPTHERLLGVAASEVLGKPLPDTHEHVKAAIAQVVATGQAVELVRQAVPVNGELQIHEVSIVPERDAAGRIVSVLGLGRNMTEYYRLRDEIAAREQEFRALVEQAPEPIIRYAPDGRRIFVNAAVERITAIPIGVLLGELAAGAQLVSAQQGAAVTALVRRICETGEPAEVEVENVGGDGRLRHFHMRFAPEFGADGKVRSVLSICHDITARKLAEETVQRSEQLMRTVIDATPDWIFIKDQEHRYRLVNKGYANALHLAPEDFIGKNDLDLGFPEELVKGNPEKGIRGFWADDRLVLDSNKTQIYPEDPATIDGEVHTFHTIKVPLRDDGGKPWGVLAFARDITERKLAERQLKETLEFSEGVINAIPDLLFEVDREGRYLNVWAQNQQLLAAQKELLLGNTINEVLAPEAAAVSMAAIREAEEKGLSLGKTMRLDLPHGESWFELSVSRKSGSDTSAPHFLVLSRDVTERKLAEVALRASEALAQSRNELLQAIVESSPEIIVFALDTNYRYLSFNQKHKEVMLAIWGKEIAVGMNMLEVIGDHPDRKSAQRGMDRALAGENFVHEEAYGDEARSRQYWQNYWSPIRSDAGKVVGLTCFVLNITERKKAEEAVRESGAKLRSLFELSPLGIALTDMQGRYVEFNESFRSICGYPADELMTLDYWTLTPRQYEMQEITQLESLAKTGRYGPYEKEYRQKDGTLVPIQLVGTLITGKDGQQHIWSIVEDIRERKRTEAELKERLDRIIELNDHLEKNARDLEDQAVELEAQAVELEASQEQIKQTEVWYRSILHSAPDGMLVVDDRGFIMLVNERLEAMFGYEHGELQGQAVEVLIPHAVRERHVDMRDGFISREDAYRQAAKTLFGCRKDGTEFPVDVSLARLPEVEGMRSAICASVRDISARHAMEAAREAALEEVQHLAQLRSTFMAQMSHELRTPLNGILGYAQNLLQGDPLGEKQTAGLQIIQNSGEHLLTLINGILDHAAIEADKFELIPGDIELEPFLSTLIGIIRVRAEQKNLSFVCDAQTDLPAVVRGDAQRLRQVLLNLLANAVKFTDRGQVTLRVLCSAPSRLRFEVQDSGVGIVPEQLEAIFIPFEQGGEVSRRAGGTGLGLAISRKLVRLMGGDIKVESSPGTGSTFSFEIDMAAVHSGDEKVNAAALSEQAVTRVVHATSQLLAPPKAELDILHGSALRGNMRDVTKHADRLAAQDSRYLPFVEQLHQLAKGFQTKALLSLIEQYRNEDGGQP
jgi:PAS domain S-box-containing protein